MGSVNHELDPYCNSDVEIYPNAIQDYIPVTTVMQKIEIFLREISLLEYKLVL